MKLSNALALGVLGERFVDALHSTKTGEKTITFGVGPVILLGGEGFNQWCNSINAYEYAHLCKQWAYSEGVTLLTYYEEATDSWKCDVTKDFFLHGHGDAHSFNASKILTAQRGVLVEIPPKDESSKEKIWSLKISRSLESTFFLRRFSRLKLVLTETCFLKFATIINTIYEALSHYS